MRALLQEQAGRNAKPAGSGEVSGDAPLLEEKTRSIRVSTDKLDSILDLTCEIVTSRERLGQELKGERVSEKSMNLHSDSERLCRNLQEAVMKARMVPLLPIFRQYSRTVRDMSQALGKRAALQILGEEVDVDTAMADGLRDPLTHLLRNALDHGLESPDVRTAAGKDPLGRLELKASQGPDGISIRVSDDGAGLPRDRILERVRALGLAAEPERLSDPELFSFIFLPGFSTAKTVTSMSGRGVGLDIVRRNVEALRGTVDVESRKGFGTTFTIRLPLTTAIIQGFSVGVGRGTYIIPLETVVECVALPSGKFGEDGRGVFNFRGRTIPCVHLGSLFNVERVPTARERVVILQQDSRRMGVVVERIFGNGQAVIKPLPSNFQRLPGVSGATILGDGKVALVVDVPGIFKKRSSAKCLQPSSKESDLGQEHRGRSVRESRAHQQA